jgi:hypothetical protein
MIVASDYPRREWSGIAQAAVLLRAFAGAVAGFAEQFDVRDALAFGPGW